jgi:hypothetical protein
MPRNRINPKDRAEPTMDTIKNMLQTTPEENGTVIEEYRRYSGRPLETGDTFNIRLGRQEAERMKVVIDVQWVVVGLAAISGLSRTWETTGTLDSLDNSVESEQAKP